MFEIPILLITFNRPDHTRQVLSRILEVQPQNLYVFQDGAREGNEADLEKCAQVREVIEKLTKNTAIQLYTFFSDKNLGCGPGPFAAISWFFQNVEYGIIMEDDVIPHPLFWNYMAATLPKYKDDKRIGAVLGHNYYRKYSLLNSYYFTFDTEGTLGWGTYRRVWEKVQFDVKVDKQEFCYSMHKFYGIPKSVREREATHFATVLNCDRHDRWDYQLEYCLKLNGFLNLKPNSCLTSHEGDDPDATHSGYSSLNYKMEVHEKRFAPIKHPVRVHVDFMERLRVLKRAIKLFLK